MFKPFLPCVFYGCKCIVETSDLISQVCVFVLSTDSSYLTEPMWWCVFFRTFLALAFKQFQTKSWRVFFFVHIFISILSTKKKTKWSNKENEIVLQNSQICIGFLFLFLKREMVRNMEFITARLPSLFKWVYVTGRQTANVPSVIITRRKASSCVYARLVCCCLLHVATCE